MSTTTTPRPTSSSAAAPTAGPGSVLAGVLRTSRRTVALWALAVSTVAVLYTSFYPSIGGEQMDAMMESMPQGLIDAMGLQDMASAAGYVSATVFSLLGAILTLVFAIGTGARVVAGAEEDGVLELEVTAPVGRTQVLLERLAALWLMVLALMAALFATLLALAVLLDLDLSVVSLAVACLALWVFGSSLGSLAFGVGAATGRRGLALGAAAGVAALGYVLSYLAPLVEGAAWLARVSPYEWYIGAEPLANGLTGDVVDGLARLVALGAVAALAGWVRFRRRDLLV